MSEHEAMGGQAEDMAALIDRLTRTMVEGPADTTTAGVGAPTHTEAAPLTSHGTTVVLGRYPGGEPQPINIDFRVVNESEGSTSTPEVQALWFAIDVYADEARSAREQRHGLRMADFPNMPAYLQEADRLDTEAARLERRSSELNRIVDGLEPQKDRPDGRKGMVSVNGPDAAKVHSAMLHGFQMMAERDSGGDEQRYEAILSQRMAALAYTDPSAPQPNQA